MAEPIVPDASLLLALFLREIEDEAWINRLSDSPLVAPDLLPYELANGMVQAHKQKRFHLENAYLLHLPDLEISWLSKETWWAEAIRMTRQWDITIYDAAYMAVAKVSEAILCTLDRKQMNAAKKEKLVVLSSPIVGPL